MISLLPASATNNSSPIFTWKHPELRSCGCFHVKLVLMLLKQPVSGTNARDTGTHLFKHFSVLSLNETCSLLPFLRECQCLHLRALLRMLLAINQFLALQPFGLIIPSSPLHDGHGTNAYNVRSQINTNLLFLCRVSFPHAGMCQHRVHREASPNSGRFSLLIVYLQLRHLQL